MSLQTHSSLNSALEDASSVAETFQSDGGDEGAKASGLQGGAEEGEQPSHVNTNAWRKVEDGKMVNGKAHGEYIDGDGVKGLSTELFTVSSIAAVEDLSEGDEEGASSSSDYEPFQVSELQLIENALRSLRNVGEGNIDASKAMEEQNLSSSDDLQELQDVTRLLKKVQAFKARNSGTPLKHASASSDGNLGQGAPGGEILEPTADIGQVVQAAAQTALAAAKTAETVVSSLNRNSLAMEELCKALTTSNALQVPRDREKEQDGDEDDEEKQMLAMELQQTEIAKNLVRQNRMTHWVLGFIVVSSIVWRYGVVKFVKRVNNTIQNPFQGITDMFKGKEPSEKEEGGGLPQGLPHLKFPSILGGEEEAGEAKHLANTENEDNNVFDLGRMFLGGQEPKEPKKELLVKAEKEDNSMFDLGKIFRGGEEPKEKKERRKFNIGSVGSNVPGHVPNNEDFST